MSDIYRAQYRKTIPPLPILEKKLLIFNIKAY